MGGKATRDYVIGDRVGRWTVIGPKERKEYASQRPWSFRVRCECGTEKVLAKNALAGGHTLSCGCRRPEILREQRKRHGEAHTRLHTIWKAMNRRCRLVSDSAYASYGGRGVSVCQDWIDSYEAFRDWARAHGYTDALTLDRIDGTKGYSPDNCRWATYREQANNLRTNHMVTAFGERKSLAEWGRDPRCLVSSFGLQSRLSRGWESEQAISTARYVHVKPSRVYRTKARLAYGMEPSDQDHAEATRTAHVELLKRVRAWEAEGIRLAVLYGLTALELPRLDTSTNDDPQGWEWDLSDKASVERARRMVDRR